MLYKKIIIVGCIFTYCLSSNVWCAHNSATGAAAAAAVATADVNTPIAQKPVYVFFRLKPLEGNQFHHGNKFTAATTMNTVTPWILKATDLEGFNATSADLRVVEGVKLDASTAEENKKIMDRWQQQPPLRTFTGDMPLYSLPSLADNKRYGPQICVTLSTDAHARYLKSHKEKQAAEIAATEAAIARSNTPSLSNKADDQQKKTSTGERSLTRSTSAESLQKEDSQSQSKTEGTGKSDVPIAIKFIAHGRVDDLGSFESNNSIAVVLGKLRELTKHTSLEQADLAALEKKPDIKAIADFFNSSHKPKVVALTAPKVGSLPHARVDREVYLTFSEEGNKKFEVEAREIGGTEMAPAVAVSAAAAASSAASGSSTAGSSPSAPAPGILNSLLRRLSFGPKVLATQVQQPPAKK